MARYVALGELGRGAMGVVFDAYDPELDRRVALKLLNPAGRPRDTSRLVREAQALARLSHPAIASVFDVGVCEYGAFVVMERVVGRSLHELLGGRARRWSALRPLFLEIGDALAAAHDANLVHRDIKPANIMIDQRGRPRIIDFGLAHDPRESGSTIAGTPSYMAPEALEGAPIDARADVYSYCVVLFEALTGTRPFVGDTLAAQLASKRYARPWERLSRRLPSRLRRALERGLDPDSARRHGSMSALLGELRRDVWRARTITTVAVVGLAGGWAVYSRAAGPPPACAALGAQLEQVWSPARRDAVERAFSSSPRARAASTWRAVATQLDAYTQSMIETLGEVCDADAEPRQVMCLRARAAELEGLVESLDGYAAGEQGLSVELAASEAVNLVPARSCLETTPRAAPDDVASKALRERLRAASTLSFAGRHDEARAAAESAVASARARTPLHAEALLTEGRIALRADASERAIQALREAAFVAQRADDHYLAGVSATELVCELARRPQRHDEARVWVRLAQVNLERVSSAPLLEAELLECRGQLEEAAGAYTVARAYHQAAYELRARQLSPPHIAIARSESRLAIVELLLGEHDEALALVERSLRTHQLLLGTEHPVVASLLENMAAILRAAGRVDESLAVLEQAIAIFRENADRDPRGLAGALRSQAILRMARGELDEAARALDESDEVAREVGDPGMLRLVATTRGSLRMRRGDFDGAIAALRGPAYGPEVPRRHRFVSRSNLSHALERSGACDEALEVARDTLELAATPEDTDPAYTNLGYARLCLGDLEEATRWFSAVRERGGAPLHRAGAIIGLARVALRRRMFARAEVLAREAAALPIEVHTRAQAEWVEAQALAGRGRVARALAVAERARASMEAAGGYARAEQAELERWRRGLAR